jgi:uncharacterized protein YcfJ
MRVVGAMKVLVSVVGLAVATAALATPPSWSNSRHRGDGYDYAQVVNVEPLVRHVRVERPQRECYDDTRYVESQPQISDPAVGGRTLLGGIIGGVIGHQIGHGSGRDFATIAGATIGAGVGYNTAARRIGTESHEETVRRCDVSYRHDYEERIDGYRVTYAYNGREYTTDMPYDPGDRIRVRVDVAPAE